MKNSCICLLIIILSAACRKQSSHDAGWSAWTVADTAVFRGQYPLVGDPSVIKDNNVYRMYYTGFDPYRIPQGPEICEATSSDGSVWENLPGADSVQGRILYSNSNTWSTAHETCFGLKWNNKYYLWFIGYKDTGAGVFGSGPVSIGLATATDGVHFFCLPDPVLVSSLGGPDRDALSSPTVIPYHDSLLMIYAGFCYTGCGPSVTSTLLAALSADGIHWQKRNDAIISAANIPWAPQGVAEAELVEAQDNYFYLFMTSVNDPQAIGVARSKTPFGPWETNPNPVVRPDHSFSARGAVAPSVLIEGDRVRMWYHGFSAGAIQVGYAESKWPLKR